MVIQSFCSQYAQHARSLSNSTNDAANDFLKVVEVAIPSGAGELAQGQLTYGEDFLVTNPVSRFSHIRVGINHGPGLITILPHSRTKTKKAVIETLKLFAITDVDVTVSIESKIPIGKGMASSTADIVGVIEATVEALGLTITPQQISDIAISIEPSDGLMYRGAVVYNHRSGRLFEELGRVPQMDQLIVDSQSNTAANTVDTVAFNNIPKNYTQKEIEIQSQALDLVREGVRTSDIVKIGRGATLSAQVNERLLPKPRFEVITAIAFRFGACGVACAHSGTILSLLFTPENTYGLKRASIVLKEQGFTILHTHSIADW